MLTEKAEFPVMRLGNAITPQAPKPGFLQFSTIARGLAMLNLVLSLLFYMKRDLELEIATHQLSWSALIPGMGEWFLWALINT